MQDLTEYTLTTGDVARQLNVSVDTVARWADRGDIACRRAPGLLRGHRKFSQADVDAYAARMAGGAS